MLIIVGIKASDMNIDIAGTTIKVTKVIAADPKGISEVYVVIIGAAFDVWNKLCRQPDLINFISLS